MPDVQEAEDETPMSASLLNKHTVSTSLQQESSRTFSKPHIGLSPRKHLGIDGTPITPPPRIPPGYLATAAATPQKASVLYLHKNVPGMNLGKLNLSEPSNPGLKEASSDSNSNFHRNCMRAAQQSLRRSSGSETFPSILGPLYLR